MEPVTPIEHRLQVEGHDLFALALNPEQPGHPIILLHGIGSTPRFWSDDHVSIFLKHGPCYALSLPGHYPAKFPTGFRQEMLTPDMMAHVLEEAIRRLVGNQPVTLAGHSTGGFAALVIAACCPSMARRVISISGFAQGKWTGVLGQFQWLTRRGPIGQTVFKLWYPVGRISPGVFLWAWRIYATDLRALFAYPELEACARGCYSDFRRLDLDAMAQYFSVMPDTDISSLLPRIAAPTLVVTGDQDPTVPPAQARLIVEKIPNADLAWIEGGGHLLFAERPTEYRRVLSEWLQRTTNDCFA